MDDVTSKSQKKRDASKLQKIGMELVDLPDYQLDKLPLSPNLKQAIIDARTIKSHGAMRRQAQLIGKLMRSADTDMIFSIREDLQAEDSAKTALFHDIEQWRDRLISGGKEALTDLIRTSPQVDVQQLRHLIKKAVEEKDKQLATGASKALFRFLRSHFE